MGGSGWLRVVALALLESYFLPQLYISPFPLIRSPCYSPSSSLPLAFGLGNVLQPQNLLSTFLSTLKLFHTKTSKTKTKLR